jgi:hypothetical protein
VLLGAARQEIQPCSLHLLVSSSPRERKLNKQRLAFCDSSRSNRSESHRDGRMQVLCTQGSGKSDLGKRNNLSRCGSRLESNPSGHLRRLAGAGLDEPGSRGLLGRSSFDWNDWHLLRALRMSDHSTGIRWFHPEISVSVCIAMRLELENTREDTLSKSNDIPRMKCPTVRSIAL